MKLAAAFTLAYTAAFLVFGAPVLHEVCAVMASR
jgi:hypothetical protein